MTHIIDLVDRDDLIIELTDEDVMPVLTQGFRVMKGSPREIGDNEDVTYTLNVPTSWGVPTTATTMEVFDKDLVNITSAVSGTPTIVDQVIMFTLLGTALRDARSYQVRITFQISSLPRSVIGEWRVKI